MEDIMELRERENEQMEESLKLKDKKIQALEDEIQLMKNNENKCGLSRNLSIDIDISPIGNFNFNRSQHYGSSEHSTTNSVVMSPFRYGTGSNFVHKFGFLEAGNLLIDESTFKKNCSKILRSEESPREEGDEGRQKWKNLKIEPGSA